MLELRNNSRNLDKLRAEIKLYRQHLFFKEQQQTLYNESINHVTKSSCIIVMDFKENFKVGGGPIETSRDFYNKSQISTLGFAIYYRDEANNLQIEYVNYLSNILSHDTLFVTDCITRLLSQPAMERFNEISFWADSGPHFRSAELMHFLFKQFDERRRIWINFFAEYHGKNIVDGHFGVLSRWFSEGEATWIIKNIDDLIQFFQDKASRSSMRNINFELYSRSSPRNHIHRLVINNFRSYLSLVKVDGKIFGSTLSTFILDNYKNIGVMKTRVTKDKRKTKYTPEQQYKDMEVDADVNVDINVDAAMGPKSRCTLLTRVKLTYCTVI